jgi:Ser/Thr protein kinase RdoA (MazF antagonist)
LIGRLNTFAKVKHLAILSDREWTTVEQAVERICTIMQSLGKESSVWGAIHSDLHHQNILVYGDEFSPIDFGNLIRGHYGFDLGVTLYHLMYLEGAARQSLVEGYQAVREIGSLPDLALEAFLCAAALVNLAFNVNLPDQRTSNLFIRNVHEFATSFCRKLVDHQPFVLL